MQGTPNVLIKALHDYLTIALAGYDESHDINHSYSVLGNAMQIVAEEHLVLTCDQLKIIQAATMVHDVPDHKYNKGAAAEAKKAELEMVLDGLVDEDGHRMFSIEMRRVIIAIIENISWSHRGANIRLNANESLGELVLDKMLLNDKLRQIVEDADRLEAIGEGGIVRCRQYTIANDVDYANAPAELKDSVLTRKICEHIKEKLEKIAAALNLDASKAMAVPKIEPLVAFLAKYDV